MLSALSYSSPSSVDCAPFARPLRLPFVVGFFTLSFLPELAGFGASSLRFRSLTQEIEATASPSAGLKMVTPLVLRPEVFLISERLVLST